MDLKIKEWDDSYANKDNAVFYPHEEVIRFTSKYIRKRVGFDSFVDSHTLSSTPKVLDLGCGIGRHVKYLHEYGLEAYGIDLSGVAIETAKNFFFRQELACLKDRLYQASITEMPFVDALFDFCISHGVLDSMPFAIARDAMKETARCLKPGALFYLDLVAGDDRDHFPEFCGEEIVETAHEKGTIQSYFNWGKILDLAGAEWSVREAFLIRKTSVINPAFHSRYQIGRASCRERV